MFFYCMAPIIALILAFILIRRNHGLERRAKLIYLIVYWLEIPGSFLRGGFVSIVIAAALTPLWIIFGIITGVSYLINPSTLPRLMALFFTLGGGLVSILAVIVGFGPLVWSLLCMLGLRG